MHKVTETIVQFKVADKAKDGAWNKLVQTVKDGGICITASDLSIFLEPHEQEYMESYYSEDPKAKKRNGQWKYSKYLPNAYRSAKSVIGRALDSGITIIGPDGQPRGKTEVERVIQRTKSSKVINVPEMISEHVKALIEWKRYFPDEVSKQLKETGLKD